MTEHFTIDEASDLAEDVGLLNCDLNEFEEKLQAFACAAVTAKLKEWEAGATDIECSGKLLMFRDELHALVKAAYKLGRNAGLVEAKQAVSKGNLIDKLVAFGKPCKPGLNIGQEWALEAAEKAIESLKDNTP